jgi:hypothetical protein
MIEYHHIEHLSPLDGRSGDRLFSGWNFHRLSTMRAQMEKAVQSVKR